MYENIRTPYALLLDAEHRCKTAIEDRAVAEAMLLGAEHRIWVSVIVPAVMRYCQTADPMRLRALALRLGAEDR